MKVKEFLRPTKWKIIIFFLLIVVISLYTCLSFFPVGCLQGCQLLSDGTMECPSCPICDFTKTLPFLFLFAIPLYLVICSLIYLSKKLKQKRKWKKKKR